MADGLAAFVFALSLAVILGYTSVVAALVNVEMDVRSVGLVSGVRKLTKDAVRSGSIKFDSVESVVLDLTDQDGDRLSTGYFLNEGSWDEFTSAEAKFRNSLSTSPSVETKRYTHANPVHWLKLFTVLWNVYFRHDVFVDTRPDNGQPYSIEFLRFSKRVLNKFPITTHDDAHSHEQSERDTLTDFIRSALVFIKTYIRPNLTAKGKQRQDRKLNGHELTALFESNQKKAIGVIKNDCVQSSVQCPVPPATIENHFRERTTATEINLDTPPPWENDITIPPPDWFPSTEMFSVDEVTREIKKLPSRKSPGKDGVTYDTLKKQCKQLAPVFTAIFNVCLRYQRVPQEWKHSVITLLPKSGDLNNIENWRPISLLNSSYKLFMKLIQARHMKWIVETKRLSPFQKGSMPRNGLMEHVFCMKTAISDFMHTSGKLFLGFIDLKDAFGSINHQFMLRELRHMGYPELFVNITKDVYTGSTFQIKCSSGLTDIIQRGKGIIQGCPWSVIVFEQGIDKWLRWLSQPYDDDHTPVPAQGYVDDVSFHVTKEAEAHVMASKTSQFVNYVGMEAKQRKCAIMHAQRSGNNWKQSQITDIDIQNKTIPVYERDQSYTYLGHEVNISNTCNAVQSERVINDFKMNMSKLDNAPVPLYVKLSLICSMAFSPVLFFFPNMSFTEKQLKEMETCIVDYIRSWFRLNTSSTRKFIFSPRCHGGLGIPNPHILYYAKHLAFQLSILNCDDPIVRTCALRSLDLHMSKRKAVKVNNPPPASLDYSHDNDSQHSFAGYAVDNRGNVVKNTRVNWPRSQWQDLSERCARANVTLCVTDDRDAFCYQVDVDDQISFRYANPKLFYADFKKMRLESIVEEFRSLTSQGRIVSQKEINHKLSASYLSNSKLSDDIKRFVVKGRLQLIECESLLHLYYPNSYTKTCKICNHPSETISHIVNGCTKFSLMYSERHNRVVNILYDKLMSMYASSQFVDVLKDTVLRHIVFTPDVHTQFQTNSTRPDITIIDRESKTVKVIEISTPFDGHIDACYATKFNKYFPLSQEINSLGFRSEIIVLVIGSLGNVHSRFPSGLKRIGFNNSEATFLAKYLSISAIIGSFRVWKARCKAHPF